MSVVEFLAIVGAVTILRSIVIIVAEVIKIIAKKMKVRFALKCPKCRTSHNIYDQYCRMCGYKLGGLSGWHKRRKEKANEKIHIRNRRRL